MIIGSYKPYFYRQIHLSSKIPDKLTLNKIHFQKGQLSQLCLIELYIQLIISSQGSLCPHQNYYTTLLPINSMSKEIQMFEISDQNDVVGTEIMDPNLPSNLDFDQKEEHQQEHASINPEKKISQMGKALVIGNDMKEFRIKGKAMFRPETHLHIGSPVPLGLQTHPVHLFGQESHGLKKLWQSIIGYAKREMLVKDGQIYLMQRRGKGLVVDSVIHLWDLFKVFVDPQDQKIRLVVNSQNRLVNIDIQPANFILVLNLINHELNAIGTTLSD